ncbi:hypothetical protein C0993_005280 [Termitomyces sp. T159_Od127]|nr:hypothetical protein C0993_005280 [Termitomyces sp. T159_Od127]
MEAFNIAVGVSNIINCVTGACTLGIYRKNEPCKIDTHLDTSKQQLLTAFDDLAKFANILERSEYSKLETDCNELRNKFTTSVAAVQVAKANYFVRNKNFRELLKNAQNLEENTYEIIIKIRHISAATISDRAQYQRMAQREGLNGDNDARDHLQRREQDSHPQNPFSDEAAIAWQCHEQDA